MTADDSRADRMHRVARLQRLDRLFPQAPIYFLTMCTAARRPLLANQETHAALVLFGREAPDHGGWIGRWVLMPDHLHMFVSIDAVRLTLSVFVKSLKNALSKHLRHQGVPSPHWQKGFFDHVLRSDESYDAKWKYVHENPVRAGLVTCAEDWPFQGEFHAPEVRRS